MELISYIVIGLVLTLALMPRPKTPGMKPATLDDFAAPTAEDGREIPVLFGTRDIEGPNCVWYGDLKTKAIKAKGGKK
jgi:hypothetical protein